MTLLPHQGQPPYKILIINPNSTTSMTSALKPLIDRLGYPQTTYTYLTGPASSPPSINDRADIAASVSATLPAAASLLASHSAALVACYSPHPLVAALRERARATGAPTPSTPPVVIGILEASLGLAMQLVGEGERFGIVSTGKQWEEILGQAVHEWLGGKADWMVTGEAEGGGEDKEGEKRRWEKGPFAGVETTGLNATELHDAPQELVERKVKEAARRLVKRGNVKAVLLGCAGMSGMDEWVRDEVGNDVRVIDGVMAGITALQGVLRAAF